MRRPFCGIRAPSTLETFLHAFTFGHVRQLDAVGARLLAALVARTPLLPGREAITDLDMDITVRETHRYAKQGAGRGRPSPLCDKVVGPDGGWLEVVVVDLDGDDPRIIHAMALRARFRAHLPGGGQS